MRTDDPTSPARRLLDRELLRPDLEASSAHERLADLVDRATEDGSLVAAARSLLLGAEGGDLFRAGLAEGHERAVADLLAGLVSSPHDGGGQSAAEPSDLERRVAILEHRLARPRRLLLRFTEVSVVIGLFVLGWTSGRNLLPPRDITAAALALLGLAGLRLALHSHITGRLRATCEMAAVAATCGALVFLATGISHATMGSTWIALSDVASVGSAACSLYTLSRMRSPAA